MIEREKLLQSFLERWSRRKLGAGKRADTAADAPARETANAPPDAPAAASPDSAVVAFDPASLPPIESINAASDVRAFLAPGVPLELARAALRRAWASDPAIRDFIGLAENQWDFTLQDGVPGFGSLEVSPDLRRMLKELYSNAPTEDPAAAADSATASGSGENFSETASPGRGSESPADKAAANPVAAPRNIQHADDDDAAMRDDFVRDGPNRSPTRRKHGRALPK